ncbi:hypothetical protein [Ferruginibacter albus]|uniref:hypothetical protein n=1 Tax=Ferruginibacter albus TaxID=2875540 RepID=UPI001CC7F5DE|nr:hypothetical protein [Ferruginibacter albus]UAY53247.1 hypothetical protein K9M53_06140 [Ferruginibacter albus]
MILLPYKKIISYSELDINTIIKILNEKTEPYSGFWFGNYIKSSMSYVGRVSNQSFDIRPVFRGRNSFIPVVRGNIKADENGTVIRMTIRPLWGFTIFILLVIGLAIFSFIKSHSISGVFVVFVVYIIMIFLFNVEYLKMKASLKKYLLLKDRDGNVSK